MEEAVERGLRVWNLIQRDSHLVEGLDFGGFEDLFAAVIDVATMDKVRRTIPLTTSIRMGSIDATNLRELIEIMQELLRVRAVAEELSRLADTAGS